MKSYSRFTSELTTRAWAIRRSLASLRGVAVMAIAWRECYTRAREAILIARSKAEYQTMMAADLARAQAAEAGFVALAAEKPDCAYVLITRDAMRRVFG